MNLNKMDVKNKNTNLYCIFYILFIHNQRKTTKKLITEKIPFPTVFISLMSRSTYPYKPLGRLSI
jgi:hypothetical protein